MGLIDAIRRRKGIVAISTLLVPAVVLVVSLGQDPRYEATATVRVDPAGEAGVSSTDVLAFADADEVALRAGEELGGVSEDFVSDRITVSEGAAANTYEIVASSDTPGQAADLATTFAEQFVDYADGLGDEFAGKATVVEEADPPADPVSPRTVRDTLFGALAGLLAGIVIALVRDALDRRVKSPRELEELLGVPVLAGIPRTPVLALDETLRDLPAAEAELFRMARVGLRYVSEDRELSSVLITSPRAGDGKTTVAFGLAAAAASGGETSLLIEADMRQPKLSAVAEPAQAGLGDVLAGDAGFEDALTAVEVTTGAEEVSGSIDLLLAGSASPNPIPLLESERMAELLEEAGRTHDLVVVDTPPATSLPDAVPLVGRVDGVVLVVGLSRDRGEDVEALQTRLEAVGGAVVGVIANFARPLDESHYEHIRAHEAAVAEAGTVPLRAPDRRAAPAARRRGAQPVKPVTPLKTRRAPDGTVDLNEATYEELRALDLSITQAKRLIAYRERRGGFSSLDDIDDVPGLPDDVLDELKDRSSVGS